MDTTTSTKPVVATSERGQILLELVVISCFLIGFVLAMAALGTSTTQTQSQYRFQNGSFKRSTSFR